MKSSLFAFAVLVAATSLSGCALFAQSTPTAVPSLSPAPAATQVRETGLVAPARPFGGDCAALMSESEASTILGREAVLAPRYAYFAPEFSAELHAGLHCRWDAADGSYSDVLTVVLLPAGAVTYDAPAGCKPADEERSAHCAVEGVVNDTRVSGVLWTSTESLEQLEAQTTAFLALFEQRATAAQPAPVLTPAIGAWAHPVDCAAVVAAGDFSGVPGLGAASVGTQFPFGSHEYALPAEDALEDGSAEEPYCWIDGEEADTVFVALGGGRWLEDTVVAEGGVPFALEGYESAYQSAGQEDMTKVDVFDGPNWLHFEVRYPKNAKALADALFAALDTTAAS